jgi:uncharacterized protein (DUF58 family)
MNIKEVRRVVGAIKSNLFKNSNSTAIGVLKTQFKGHGLQFKEHQVYAHGDDVRFIDWKMLAKTNSPYVKTFEEERNVEIVVIIDASLSMLNGYNGVSKLQASIELCCLLYLLSEESHDLIHAVVVSDEVINLPKLNGDKGISLLISILEKHKIIDERGKVNIFRTNRPGFKIKDSNFLVQILKHLKKRREVVIFSDFNEFLSLKDLNRLIFRNNFHCFKIASPLDETTSSPFMLLTGSENLLQKKNFGVVNFSGEDEQLRSLGKRFRKLKVHERYLEDFIKEMH